MRQEKFNHVNTRAYIISYPLMDANFLFQHTINRQNFVHTKLWMRALVARREFQIVWIRLKMRTSVGWKRFVQKCNASSIFSVLEFIWTNENNIRRIRERKNMWEHVIDRRWTVSTVYTGSFICCFGNLMVFFFRNFEEVEHRAWSLPYSITIITYY